MILSNKTVKIRVPHRCWGCGREYPIGTSMRGQAEKDNGKVSTTYWCYVCDKYLSDTRDSWDDDDGINFGELKSLDDYPK